jgi:hypothetical protein
MFLFKDADDLRVETTNHFYNGGYTHTTYSYVWTDDRDRQVFAVSGQHKALNKSPPRTDLYHFAQEAETSWSVYLLNRILGKLQAGGSWTFHLSGSNRIRIRSDLLQLTLRGNTQDFAPQDIAEMQIQNGQISLKEPGARAGWFTDTGIHHFSFAEVANARVFLLLVNHLFQVPITG